MENTFSKRLRALRVERGLSRRALGEAIYISASSVRHLESGNTRASGDTLIAIARYFDVSSDYLLGLSDHRQSAPERLGDCMERAYSALYTIREAADNAAAAIRGA